jgi:PAS domain S-box-containing protein
MSVGAVKYIKNILLFLLFLTIMMLISNVVFILNTTSFINEHHIHQIITTFIISLIITVFILLILKIKKDINKQNNILKQMVDNHYKETSRFEEFANMLPEGLYETDLTGVITFATENLTNIIGIERSDELIGKNIFSFLDKESIGTAKNNFKKILKEDIRTPREYVIQTNKGKKYIILQAHKRINEVGDTIGTRGTIIDITDVKKLENKYSVNYKVLELTLDSIQIPIYLQNMKGEIINFNYAFQEFCNKKHEDEVRRKIIFDLLPHEVSRIIYKKTIELMRLNSHSHNFSIKHDKYDIFITQTKFINEDDKLSGGVITTIQDLTVINSIKNKLSMSEESFKVLSDESILGVVILKNDDVVYINDKIVDIIGYKKNEIIFNKPFIKKVIIDKDQDKFFGMLNYTKDHEKVSGRLKIRTKSGIIKYIELNIKKVEYDGGFSNLITVIDITPYININR